MEVTDAVVVRATPVGESDLVVGLYTRALGRISAVAEQASGTAHLIIDVNGYFQ